jgi:hypothetical protein
MRSRLSDVSRSTLFHTGWCISLLPWWSPPRPSLGNPRIDDSDSTSRGGSYPGGMVTQLGLRPAFLQDRLLTLTCARAPSLRVFGCCRT